MVTFFLLSLQLTISFIQRTATSSHSKPVTNRKTAVWLQRKNKPFSCSECEKSFETEEALTQHMKEYSEVKDVFCPECGNNFKTKHWLMAHRRLYILSQLCQLDIIHYVLALQESDHDKKKRHYVIFQRC
uniref:C2H2-type domain-containing protein n=1 Tax=Cyprinodon variegatus TaxID=28743 RepID=A0A3Q2GBE4_CYPVA